MSFEAAIPLITGLVGVGAAILERGYKRYLEEKKLNPELKFSAVYMLNLLVSTGAGTVIVTTIIPALIAALQNTSENQQLNQYVGLAAIFINLALGYALTYRFLDGLNNSTDKKLATAKTTEAPKPGTP